MLISISRGDIFHIADKDITLPPESVRGQVHQSARPFLILSTDLKNRESSFPIVVGCPISTSTTYKTQFDVKLGAGEGNLPKKSWVRVPAIQPISKDSLGHRLGSICGERLLEIDAGLAEFLDMGE